MLGPLPIPDIARAILLPFDETFDWIPVFNGITGIPSASLKASTSSLLPSLADEHPVSLIDTAEKLVTQEIAKQIKEGFLETVHFPLPISQPPHSLNNPAWIFNCSFS